MARQVLHVERLVQILVLLVLVGRLIESAGHAMDRTHSTGRHTRPGQDARRTLPGPAARLPQPERRRAARWV